MFSTFKVVTAREIIDLVVSGKLNPDPISQRPPTSSGHTKSNNIVEALYNDLGIGMIAVRDISQDASMQKVYPGVQYLVIDGGHRARALVEYYTGKFKAMDSYFNNLSTAEAENFLNKQIPFESIVCTSQEATRVFRARNKTTNVNFMEMIMCDDESPLCKEVRTRTKYYKEYNNNVHPLFETVMSSNGEVKSECFDTEINKRRRWDEYVFIAILKALGGGNVDAGQREIESLLEKEYNGTYSIAKSTLSVVDRFFDDVRSFRFMRGRKINGEIFNALQLVWFELYEQNKGFRIEDMDKFCRTFMKAYSLTTGTGDRTYDNKIVDIGTADHPELVPYKEFIRSNIKNFSNSHVQKICAKFLLEEMLPMPYNGVVFREEKRSLSTKEREEKLAIQGYKCAIDGELLTLEDSVWGHDTPWAKGGKLEEGAVIRKSHNTDMGSTTLEEYRMILNLRKMKVA